ncbi:hypothetical protein NUT40_13485 [Staphylococcus saprophyticus]|nr:hypothetical protein NUT40_13485 [Staphylococcus saprophyticus]
MKYRLSLSVVLATSLILSTTVAQAQEGNHKQTTEKNEKENTSKPINFEKAQKMSPQALKDTINTRRFKIT